MASCASARLCLCFWLCPSRHEETAAKQEVLRITQSRNEIRFTHSTAAQRADSPDSETGASSDCEGCDCGWLPLPLSSQPTLYQSSGSRSRIRSRSCLSTCHETGSEHNKQVRTGMLSHLSAINGVLLAHGAVNQVGERGHRQHLCPITATRNKQHSQQAQQSQERVERKLTRAPER